MPLLSVQADVRQLFLTVPLELDEGDLVVNLEAQVEDRRRIDVETGSTVVEVKRDLRKGKVRTEGLTSWAATSRSVSATPADATWVC